MENYIFTYDDGILYRNGVKLEEDMSKNKTSKIKYDYNSWIVYCENCKSPVDTIDEYCSKCGSKLIFDKKENKKFMDEYDKQITHPYGWPLTRQEIIFAIDKPVYIDCENNISWKVINKIEIVREEYYIFFTDGSRYPFSEILIYDPTNIVKQNLYPSVVNKEKKDTISTIRLNDTEYKIRCDCKNYCEK